MGLLYGWGPLASHVIQPDSRTPPHRGPAGLARIARFRGDHGRPHPRCRRGHSARPGAGRSSRGQPTRSGRGFPSPTASNAPARDDMSPAARSAPARTIGPDHEWARSHQPPGSPYLQRPALHPSSPPRAGQQQKQAAPHLRCGAAGVGAPVQARCSLSGEDCSRHPLNAPTSERGHRTSSVGGILLPDPPS